MFRTALKIIKAKDDALRALMPQRVAFWFIVALYATVLVVILYTRDLYAALGLVPVAILQSLLLKDESVFRTLARVASSWFHKDDK